MALTIKEELDLLDMMDKCRRESSLHMNRLFELTAAEQLSAKGQKERELMETWSKHFYECIDLLDKIRGNKPKTETKTTEAKKVIKFQKPKTTKASKSTSEQGTATILQFPQS